MSGIKKICEWCQKEFEGKHKDTQCCTQRCRLAKWKRENPEKVLASNANALEKRKTFRAMSHAGKICEWCQKKLETKRRDARFCERKCRDAKWHKIGRAHV